MTTTSPVIRTSWVAGYNLLNEPADESRKVVGPFYLADSFAFDSCEVRKPLLAALQGGLAGGSTR